ncbi:hypothetical protein GCM10011309_10110 [Litorimonas cladophorae]|uniref:HTH arsR-type domain-containing protein n=1 Tax=Litorimonas cladophorae TaxID=1220491 RepID=A0A918KHS9_9PROT|nr:metalloregulator ArsR/SmtB family transcription factor [Litorimonas cladophorae]GGX62143.1 hypothetical protein GCM10011309_10110 [Litorimonas cladophorae]
MSFSEDMIAKAPQVAAQLKLLSNPNRLMIVCRLLEGELSVGDIEEELGIRQPTLSRELGHLRDAEIISPRRQSKVVFYSLTSSPMRNLIEAICEASGGGSRNRQKLGVPARGTKGQKAIAFNPRPKFTKSGSPSSEDRGYSVFASTKKQGV